MPYKYKKDSKERSKKYYIINKEKIKKKNKEYYSKNKEKIKEERKEYYSNNKEGIKKRGKKYRKKNIEKVKAYEKFRNIRDRDKRNKASREYYAKNKKDLIKKKKIYEANRSKKDPSFKLIRNLRRRTLYALKGKDKSANTMTLLGVPNIEFVWNHLEKSFKPGMTRKNHGKWHIDHIKPCASFNLTKPSEQRECFHYTNLQPLWASENLAKGSKIS